MKKVVSYRRTGILCLFACIFSVLPQHMSANTQASVPVKGTVYASTLADGSSLELTGYTNLHMDVSRQLKGISGGYELNISGDKNLIINSGSHGISVDKLTTYCNLNIISKKDGLNVDKDIIIRSGNISIDPGDDGIYSRNGNITIEDGYLNVESGTNCAAVYAPKGNITMKKGTLTARGAKFGIITDEGSITLGGYVTATAAGWAVWAKQNVTVTDGSLTAKSAAYAVTAANGTLTISGDVTAESGAEGCTPLCAKKDVIINSGNIIADCSTNGSAIASWEANVNIKGGIVTANGAKFGIYAEKGSINIGSQVCAKGFWAIWAQNNIYITSPYFIKSPLDGVNKGKYITNSSGDYAHTVFIDSQPLTGTVAIDQTTISPGYHLHCQYTGDVANLDKAGKVSVQWQISSDGATNWSNLSATASDGAYIVTVADLDKFIRARVTATGYDGVLYSSPRKVVKQACYVDVVQANLSVTGTQIYVTNPKITQEYLIFNYKKSIGSLTESDWNNAKTPTSQSSSFLMGGTANQTNYVYTRVKETSAMLAGTDVCLSFTYAGTNTYMQGIELSAKGISSSGVVSPLEQSGNDYYTKVGDVVKITATPVPQNATNFSGIFYDSWTNNSKSGTFYADYKCTTTLQSGEYYKVVYFKPSVQKNSVDIRAQCYLGGGPSNIAYDDFYLHVGDANGIVLATSVTAPHVYICKGEKQEGIVLSAHPTKATLSNIKYTLSSSAEGSGTAPVLTAASDGTLTVDGTKATKGTYYYTMTQNGTKVNNSVTVDVTNYKIEEVQLSPTEITADPDDEYELVAQTIPADTDDKITWSSNNTSVATVSTTGKVKINSNADIGKTAVITASAGGKSAKCTITIAGEKYNVVIDGVQVTTRNMTDVLGDGVFAFDGIRTLTVNGDYNTSKQLIVSTMDGLIIDVASQSKLTSTAVVVNLTGNTSITGKGGLTLTREGGSALQLTGSNDSRLKIENMSLVVNGGITGSKNSKSQLSVEAASVTANAATSTSAVTQFTGGIELTDCNITKPASAKIADGSIVAADGSAASQVVIESTITTIEDLSSPDSTLHHARKIVIDGNIYILLPDGRIYDILGSEVTRR